MGEFRAHDERHGPKLGQSQAAGPSGLQRRVELARDRVRAEEVAKRLRAGEAVALGEVASAVFEGVAAGYLPPRDLPMPKYEFQKARLPSAEGNQTRISGDFVNRGEGAVVGAMAGIAALADLGRQVIAEKASPEAFGLTTPGEVALTEEAAGAAPTGMEKPVEEPGQAEPTKAPDATAGRPAPAKKKSTRKRKGSKGGRPNVLGEPWKADGVSRRTWERRRAKAGGG